MNKSHLLQRHSGQLKICSSLVFYTSKWCKVRHSHSSSWNHCLFLVKHGRTEDLCNHPVPESFHANAALSLSAQEGMTRAVRDAGRGHGSAHGFTGFLLPTAEEQLIELESRDMPAPRPNPGSQAQTLACRPAHPEMRGGPSPGGLSGTI